MRMAVSSSSTTTHWIASLRRASAVASLIDPEAAIELADDAVDPRNAPAALEQEVDRRIESLVPRLLLAEQVQTALEGGAPAREILALLPQFLAIGLGPARAASASPRSRPRSRRACRRVRARSRS